MKKWASGAILLALVLCGIVPFAARAVYLDEHLYLHIAESAVEESWLFPQDAEWIFFGTREDNLAAHTHPPLGEYCLALMLMLLGGFAEAPFRLLWGIFSLLTVLGFYRLARHFTTSPLIVTSLFAVSPAFFVISPTLMMDIPMLGFFLVGFGFYLDHVEGRSPPLWLASLCFVLSVGFGYTILIPLGCLFVWAVAGRRPKSELLAMAAAPAMIFAWMIVMRIHFGELPATRVIQYFLSHASLTDNLLPIFSFLGGVSILPWLFLAFLDISRKLLIAATSLAAASILSLFHVWASTPSQLWFVVLASSGIGLLIIFALKSAQWNSRRRPAAQGFLVLWLPAALLFFLFAAEIITARYILLGLPPLFLVIFRRVRRPAAIASVAVTMILSLALAIGDYRFVNSYRDWVEETIVPLQKQGFRIWSATESGLRFYLEQRGIQTLDKQDLRPRGADLIVRQASFRYSLSEDLAPLLLSVLETDLEDAYPIRTFAAAADAGFHDSHFGIIPFCFSRVPLDRLELLEVSPLVTSLPQSVPEDFSSVPVWFPGGVQLKQIRAEMKFKIKIPKDTEIEYELEGEGSIDVTDKGITLKKSGTGPAIWKNLRIIPKTWGARN
jgi:hypothetical protein